MNIPNNDQLLSLLRALLQIVGTSLMAKGVVTTADWTTYSGAILMAAPIVWGYFAHTDTATLATVAAMSGPAKEAAFAGIPDSAKLAAVEAMPDVKAVVVSPTAVDGVADAASDPTRPKIVTQ